VCRKYIICGRHQFEIELSAIDKRKIMATINSEL